MEKTLKLGYINFINALPLIYPLATGIISSNFQLLSDVPTQLNHLIHEGKIDFGLISSIEYLKNKNRYDLLPTFGIAAKGKVLSVNLYLKKPISELNQAKILVTSQTASSLMLLKIICQKFWKVNPFFVPMKNFEQIDSHDGCLLIGDDALKHQTIPRFVTIDLACEWYQATGLPFVFAVFVVNKNFLLEKPDSVKDLEKILENSLTWSEKNFSIIQKYAAKKTNIFVDMIKNYYNHLIYRLGSSEKQGLWLFDKLQADSSHLNH